MLSYTENDRERNSFMIDRSYMQQGVKIELKEVLWKLLTQWKAVLLVALLAAILICGAKYRSDTRTYNARLEKQNKIAEQKELSEDEQISKILEGLSDDNLVVVELVLREQEWLSRQRKYLNRSIYMNIDPSNRRLLKMTFDIDGDDASDIPVLLQDYSMYITSDEFRDAVGRVIDPEVEKKYIGELVNTSTSTGPEEDTGQTGAMLYITIYLPEVSDADAVAEASARTLTAYSGKLKKKYNHTLTAVDSVIIRGYDYEMTNRFKDTYDRINSVNNTINNLKNTMTDEQSAALEAIGLIQNSEITDAAAEEGTIAPPSFDLKYAVFGFIIGALAYAFIYLIVLLLNGKVESAGGAQRYIGSRLFGEIYYDSEPSGFAKLLHSKFVEKLRYRGSADQAAQIDHITDTIGTVCEHGGFKSFTMLDLTGTENHEPENIITSMIAEAKEKGLEIVTAEASGDFDEKILLNISNAVLAVSADTKLSALDRVKALCRDYDINTLGCVYIAEM